MTTLEVNLPDTITTWRVYALGTSLNGLFGVAEPASLRVFSPIFLEVSLPYSVVRNEQFAVKATVFNYNERVPLADVSFSGNLTKIVSYKWCLAKVSVKLKSRSNDLCTAAGTGHVTEEQTVSSLASKSSHTFIFSVVPLNVGDIEIQVTMKSYFREESVVKVVKVKVKA